MIIQVFAVYDNKAHAYMQPFYLHNIDMGIRSFSQSVTNSETKFNLNPLDYTLFHIAEYDDEIGKHTSLHTPEQLITAPQCLIQHNRNMQTLNKDISS